MQGSNAPVANIVRADTAGIDRAVALLRKGRSVAIPTETVYGLAADAARAGAVAEIFSIKGRPGLNPLIVHVGDCSAAQELAEMNHLALRLTEKFWPGPLTLVLPKRAGANVTEAVTAGLDTIALRCPAHPVMRAVLERSGLALAAPSANRSGSISPTRAGHVASSLGDSVSLILDGGPTQRGLESTIVKVEAGCWHLLRPGPVGVGELSETAGVPQQGNGTGKIEAPGQLASHYAPTKPLRLNVDEIEADEYLIGFGEVAGDYTLSATGDPVEAAARLFDALHRADASDKARIAIAPVPEKGIGAAINDRLRRAATR